MKPLLMLGLIAMTAGAPLSIRSSAPKLAKAQCFRSADIVNWTAPDQGTLHLRLRDNRVIEATLRGPCPNFDSNDTIGFSARATRVCRGSDLTVVGTVRRVRHADPPYVRSCDASGFRTLSAEETAALPSRARP
ncbi:hypothetical protein PMI01_04114 [Caulobacter sp. AP07]|uniref:DUF6491 family protein n=1 Tax=Caulobacter sp. AP07 TaxID=1144304 RepID=UPI000271E419|nr:DUF6491 family protein [Caulobacter sp. AP07]EJL26307.1 hypothetical protein PMI01_04114 [Caulobacter sp. AP07]